jgi:hypothetical protein
MVSRFIRRFSRSEKLSHTGFRSGTDVLNQRTVKEAFAVFDEEGWNEWLDFFSSIRNREGAYKGLVEVKLS